MLLVVSGCLRYCKSTIFQANHNSDLAEEYTSGVVCDTAKVRFFKQITTSYPTPSVSSQLFAILQKYDFSSKSQHLLYNISLISGCLRYCKSTIFQANHNSHSDFKKSDMVVCDTAKVRFFKQITPYAGRHQMHVKLFAILQKYDFSSKSQLQFWNNLFQSVVCDTAKVRFFKQITTKFNDGKCNELLFAILQKYDFSSKSQHHHRTTDRLHCCLRYCKSTIFQANHNASPTSFRHGQVVCDTAKVRFFKQITTDGE